MRRLLPVLASLSLALPAWAEGPPRTTLLAPDPRCEAPALIPAAELRAIRAEEAAVVPPFRLALLSCAPEAGGAPKRPLRRT